MSVIMSMQIGAKPQEVEHFAADNKEGMQSLLEAAKGHGLIAHRFYGSEDGNSVMVLDEWPDRQSFEAFFAEQQGTMGRMFEGLDARPGEPVVWRELTTYDAYGWGA